MRSNAPTNQLRAGHGRSSSHRVTPALRQELPNSRRLRAEDRAARHDPKPRSRPAGSIASPPVSLGGRACAVRASPAQAECACRTSRQRRRRRPRSTQYERVVVDVRTEVVIDRPRVDVASYAMDPDNATAWYENIKAVEWKTPKPVTVGSRIAFVAQFLGRTLVYTYEVKELVPGERFVQATAEGPFPMETTYTWRDGVGGGTTMTLRNRGEPSGFSAIVAPMMAVAMRRANRKDLVRLKSILER